MNVLVIGSGGREHALCWALRASPLCDRLWCAPGNAGIAEFAECIADFESALAGTYAGFLAAPETDFVAMARFCRENEVDLVVVGPEAPLAAGIVDELTAQGIRVFGPTRAAAQLESSKGFAKDLCAKYRIPTAPYKTFTNPDAAKAYVREQGAPVVVKVDGLAAGKGVVVAQTVDEAEESVDAMLGGEFGETGGGVLVEAFLEGEEASFFALSDGENVLPLATAQDYKRAYDADTGPNTGGMGACSPAPIMTEAMVGRALDEIVRPTIAAMKSEGLPYQGVIYAGLMITADGPKLVEYNVRFGDPEAQVLMMRLRDDLLLLLQAAVDRQLDHMTVRWRSEAALSVVMATRGYPGSYEKGSEIRGVEEVSTMQDVEVFHGGTAREDGILKATGGRVLSVTALGRDLCEAQARAYAAIDLIDWPQGFCRRDIGWRSVSLQGSVK